ncbi:group II intron reverse transcriptase/maturase, partial [Pseudomonas aeruginosa]
MELQAQGSAQCHQPKLQPCPRQAPRSSQPPWPSGDDQASAAQSGGLAGLAV